MTSEKTLRDLVLENPAAPRVFERLGLDYCCGGGATLQEACEAANLQPADVLTWLDQMPPEAAVRDWNREPLADLAAHIQGTHHRFVRDETARLGPLFDKVCRVHGDNHPELECLRSTFARLAAELTTHLMKEEMVLFPYIVRMEEAVVAHEPALPAPFGSVRNPVQMMRNEHDGAGEALRDLRRASRNYTAPDDACISYRELYRALGEFEADLHQHIHLENNILFPRAIAMESAGR